MKIRFNQINAIKKRMKTYDKKIEAIDKRINAIMKTDKTKNLTPFYKIKKSDTKKILDTEKNLTEYIDVKTKTRRKNEHMSILDSTFNCQNCSKKL